MKIRTWLTILFTLVTAAILLVFAFIIYCSAKDNREKEFYVVLKKEAITKANIFFDAKVEASTLQNIYRSNRKVLNEVEVAIYEKDFHLLYHDAIDIDLVKETPEMIEEIYQNGVVQFYQGNWQVVGIRYEFEDESYIITATAYDQYGFNKLESLYKTIAYVFTISILFIYIVGWFFSKRTFKPITEMVEKAKQISANQMELRLSANGSNDELFELAKTFNDMLDRLGNSFDAQKNFVSNISHEMRTPLAAIIAELELSLNRTRGVEEYKSAIQYALGDARKLARLSNSLLDFAKASYDPSEIAFKTIRVDEVLLDARKQVQQSNSIYSVDIHFENDFENEDEISIRGNEYLLTTAFGNLFENGCKFSENHQCVVSIHLNLNEIELRFSDNGIGISPDDLKSIFTPFYRGDNKEFADGNGIGLSLSQKIIELHNGTISVDSSLSLGTTFTVRLTTC